MCTYRNGLNRHRPYSLKNGKMIPIKQSVLKIDPQTNVRSTKGEGWVLAVTPEYLEEYDKRKTAEKQLENPEAKPLRNLARRRQLEKYNAYKEEIRWLAKKQNFVMPQGYFALWFYVPHPKSWRPSKVKEMLYKPHQATPDWDNFIKALFDALMPRKKRMWGQKGTQDDRVVHCGAIFKIWVLPDEGCIKVIEYAENEFMGVFDHGHPNYKDPGQE